MAMGRRMPAGLAAFLESAFGAKPVQRASGS